MYLFFFATKCDLVVYSNLNYLSGNVWQVTSLHNNGRFAGRRGSHSSQRWRRGQRGPRGPFPPATIRGPSRVALYPRVDPVRGGRGRGDRAPWPEVGPSGDRGEDHT